MTYSWQELVHDLPPETGEFLRMRGCTTDPIGMQLEAIKQANGCVERRKVRDGANDNKRSAGTILKILGAVGGFAGLLALADRVFRICEVLGPYAIPVCKRMWNHIPSVDWSSAPPFIWM
jgi:hypothetical protein